MLVKILHEEIVCCSECPYQRFAKYGEAGVWLCCHPEAIRVRSHRTILVFTHEIQDWCPLPTEEEK